MNIIIFTVLGGYYVLKTIANKPMPNEATQPPPIYRTNMGRGEGVVLPWKPSFTKEHTEDTERNRFRNTRQEIVLIGHGTELTEKKFSPKIILFKTSFPSCLLHEQDAPSGWMATFCSSHCHVLVFMIGRRSSCCKFSLQYDDAQWRPGF